MKKRIMIPMLLGILVSFMAQATDLKMQLTEVVGGKESWKPKIFSTLKVNMTCDEVKVVYPALADCDPAKDYSFASVAVAEHPLISEYEFVFKMGKLSGSRIIFKSNIDKDEFKAASLELFEAKWGTVKPEKREQDILTSIGPKYIKAQRTYMGGQWRLDIDLPQTE